MRRRFPKSPEPSTEGELNLVPYLDIVVNLVMFLLLTAQFDSVYRELLIHVPGVGKGEPGDPGVVVQIGRDGYHVLGEGPWTGTIARTPDGELDGEALAAHLAAAADTVATLPAMTVTAEGDADYGTIVATIDAVRARDDGRELFPSVALGRLTVQ